MLIKNRIRELRLARGWTQLDLAKRWVVSKNSVSCWETYVFHPSLMDCILLCSVFDCSIEDLFPGFYSAVELVERQEVRTWVFESTEFV